MSRSRRKYPCIKDRYGSKSLSFYKRLSNSKIRRTEDVPDNKGFKKVFESWKIHDYISKWSESNFYKNWKEEEKLPEEKQLYHNEFGDYKKALYWFMKTYINK